MPNPTYRLSWRRGLPCLLVWLITAIAATTAIASPVPETDEPLVTTSAELLPGVEIASEITKVSGIAVSPLLGVSAVGAWSYLRATEAKRATLPWFCHPAIWGIGLSLVMLAKLKDLAGTVLPPLVKKPLDMAELFEDKASALLAAGTIVPTTVPRIADQLLAMQAAQEPLPYALNQASLLPFDLPSVAVMIALVPAILFIFGVVWLMSHAIDVLIAISPFGMVDIVLKSIKGLLLLALTIPFLIHPLFGGVVTALIVALAAWLAPAAFRLMVFGTVMSLDVLWPWGRTVTPANAHAFTARRIDGVPVRTYGRLSPAPGGTVRFSYRPWLLLPRRTLVLEHGELCLGCGLLFPSLMRRAGNDAWQRLFSFLPRYRGHETALSGTHSITHILDNRLIRGFRAMKAWFSDLVGRSRTALSARLS